MDDIEPYDHLRTILRAEGFMAEIYRSTKGIYLGIPVEQIAQDKNKQSMVKEAMDRIADDLGLHPETHICQHRIQIKYSLL